MVTNLSVVNDTTRTQDPCKSTSSTDANKKWTFGYLVTQMANQAKTGKTPSQFATAWLKALGATQTINGDAVTPLSFHGIRRVGEEALRQWRCRSGATTCCGVFALDQQGAFDPADAHVGICENEAATKPLAMNKAPFRLLAIVNRLDRRQNAFFGEGLAGELRFVFSFLDLDTHETTSSACAGRRQIDASQSVEFNPPSDDKEQGWNTAILEYAVDKTSAAEVKAYAQQWADLSALPFGSTYRSKLEAITESVVRAGLGTAKGRPNGSELIRIRTNLAPEFAVWQFHEFQIGTSGSSKGVPFATTLKQTPSAFFFGNEFSGPGPAILGAWINANQAAVETETYVVPNTFLYSANGGTPVSYKFLGGQATNGRSAFWEAAGVVTSPKARHNFSLNTCNGCHGTEGNNLAGVPFGPLFHVEPRMSNKESVLSDFLTGAKGSAQPPVYLLDPMDQTVSYNFHALQDRATDLSALVTGSTSSALAFQPTTRAH